MITGITFPNNSPTVKRFHDIPKPCTFIAALNDDGSQCLFIKTNQGTIVGLLYNDFVQYDTNTTFYKYEEVEVDIELNRIER